MEASTNQSNPAFAEHAQLFTNLFSLPRDPAAQARGLGQLFRDLLPKAGQIHVLELGCGAGHLCRHLARDGFAVSGMDRSPDMIALAHAEATLPGLVWTCADFMVADASADVVMLLYSVIQTFDSESDAFECLRRAVSFVKPGGLLLVEVSNPVAVATRYPAGQVFVSQRSGYRVETRATEQDGVRVICSDIYEATSEVEPIRFKHRLISFKPEQLAAKCAALGLVLLAERDAPEYWRNFDPLRSTSALLVTQLEG